MTASFSRTKTGQTAGQPTDALREQFIEVAEKSGIHFSLTSGGPEKRYIIEAKGGGIAWIDYDNYGFPDLFLANGSTFGQSKLGTSPHSRLYHNNGDGPFTDVGAEAGVAYSSEGQEQAGMGTDFADYDNGGVG